MAYWVRTKDSEYEFINLDVAKCIGILSETEASVSFPDRAGIDKIDKDDALKYLQKRSGYKLL